MPLLPAYSSTRAHFTLHHAHDEPPAALVPQRRWNPMFQLPPHPAGGCVVVSTPSSHRLAWWVNETSQSYVGTVSALSLVEYLSPCQGTTLTQSLGCEVLQASKRVLDESGAHLHVAAYLSPYNRSEPTSYLACAAPLVGAWIAAQKNDLPRVGTHAPRENKWANATVAVVAILVFFLGAYGFRRAYRRRTHRDPRVTIALRDRGILQQDVADERGTAALLPRSPARALTAHRGQGRAFRPLRDLPALQGR